MSDLFSFGAWLRRRRKALDLTQVQLAERASCALSTIKKIELDERRPSREVATRLAEVLEIPAGERADFLAAARTERRVDALPDPAGALPSAPARPAPPPLSLYQRPRTNLQPYLSRFIGRERELEALRALVTLSRVGPGC